MSCCITDAHGDGPFTSVPSPMEVPNSESLQIRAFYIRLSLPFTADPAPRSLTLVYSPLPGSDSELSPGAPASVALRRVWNHGLANPEDPVYASTDPVTATGCGGVGAGIRFEAYFAEERAAEGVVQRDWEGRWGMNCSWMASGVLEVRAVGEGVDLRSTARWSPRVKRRRRPEQRFASTLPRIPEEEAEEGSSTARALNEGMDYGGGGPATAMDGYGGDDGWLTVHRDDDWDGWKTGSSQELRWAVDMGVWAVCVGVGLLLSRAAASGVKKGFLLL